MKEADLHNKKTGIRLFLMLIFHCQDKIFNHNKRKGVKGRGI